MRDVHALLMVLEKLAKRVGGMEKLLCKEGLQLTGFRLEEQPVGIGECWER